MPKTKYPEGKLCKCGCGQLAKKNIQNGHNKGWLLYADGHHLTHRAPAPQACYDALVKAREAHTKPIGSRRIHPMGDRGTDYWEVKVGPGRGRNGWMLEHRFIMEERLGRKLSTDEHVHHRDGNGLNNGLHADGKSNLVVLPCAEHLALTQRESGPRKMCTCICPHCGTRSKHFATLEARPRKRHPLISEIPPEVIALRAAHSS